MEDCTNTKAGCKVRAKMKHMAKVKSHLKDLYRTNPDDKNRSGCLRLDMNESVAGLPEDFVKNMLSGINSQYLASYPGYRKLEETIASHDKIWPENIMLANGSDAAIKYIFDAYISPGDKVLMTDPTFAMYPIYCNIFKAIPVQVEYNDDLSFPARRFLKAIGPDVRLAVLVNPNNPTGSVIDKDDILAMVKKAEKNGVLIIVDEAYFYFYPESVIGEIRKHKNLIVLRTFSKLCAIASARLGYAAADAAIIEGLRKVKPTYDVNGLAVLFAQKILSDPHLIKRLVKDVESGKRYLTRKLSGEKIRHVSGNANFVLIKCGDRASRIMDELSKEKILISGGFRQSFLKEYIRVTAGDEVSMKRFWSSFIKIWNGERR